MKRFLIGALLVAVAATSAWALSGNHDVSGNQTIGGNSTVLGNSTVIGNLAVTGTSTLTGNTGVTGNTTVTGTLEVTSTSTLTGDVTLTGDIVVNGNDVTIGAAGVKITSDGDGAITLLGLGNGTDEDITINLDDTANTVKISTSTSVDTIDTSAIGLTTSGTVATGPLKVTGHATAKGTAPTASAGTIAPTSTDFAGMVTSVGATETYVTFASAYTATPVCVVSAEEAAWIANKTTVGFSIVATGNIDAANYICMELE